MTVYGTSRLEAEAYLDNFRRRVVQDALAEATAAYWRRRAETFAAVGNEECDEIAAACRMRAWVAEHGNPEDGSLPQVECPACGTPTSPWTCSCGQVCLEPARRWAGEV